MSTPPAAVNKDQYAQTEAMNQAQPSISGGSALESQTADEKPKRTFLGMRGGGLILDLCACFICCECMEGCCHAVDDCCCC
ncbi:uncharacterized protein RCC_06831 [Ramularia collo-cygni]|uniref:Uncharacterized protein n=1 Tax=Ramularia collo-cygni TaxID=112498 RepID=A0A2D3V6A7_9PEZI|nr:uncharacterized protein RCC_06831 [Ramularia collo-cygni]CZT20970.1 uncharacterized protein RCC_06831 [Ramularia collo-cygni]